VDTTLVGFENMKWIRGDLSFIFRGEDGGEVYVVDHKKQTVESAIANSKKGDAISEQEIRRLMAPEINRTAPITDNVVFTPAKTWLGYEKTEKIGDDGWKAKVLECEGFDLKVLNRKKIKRKDVQVLSPAELRQILYDKVDVEDLHPQGLLFPNEEFSEKIKSYKGTAWISDEFPRTVDELLPIFETLAPSQKHFDKLNAFISMKMPTCGFPVKLDIPCFPTVTASVTFLTHKEMEIDEEKFEIPTDYKIVENKIAPQKTTTNNNTNSSNKNENNNNENNNNNNNEHSNNNENETESDGVADDTIDEDEFVHELGETEGEEREV